MTVYRFEEIAHNINDKKMPVPGDEKTYIGLEHLDTGSLQVTRWGQDVVLTGEKLVMKKGDVLFGRRNTYLRRAAIAPHDGIFSAHGMIFRPKTDVIDAEFFPFFISSDYFIDEAIKISVGSLSPTVNWGTLKKLEFDLPSMEEQKRLAKILMAAEETRQAYKKLIKQTDSLIKAKYYELIGLVSENPHNYECLPITQICDFQGGSQPPKKDWIRENKDGYVRMLQIRDFTQAEKNNIEYVRISPSLKFCDAEDILIGRYGASVGKILTGLSGAYNVAIMRSIPNKKVLNMTYLQYYFSAEEFQNYILAVSKSRAAQAGFSKDDLNRMFILVPPMKIQEEFAKFVQQAEQTKLTTQQSLDALNETVCALVNRNFN